MLVIMREKQWNLSCSCKSKIRELCLSSRGQYDPYEIEILRNHEACLTFKKNVMLGLAVGDSMSMEDWMGVPVVEASLDLLIIIEDSSKTMLKLQNHLIR